MGDAEQKAREDGYLSGRLESQATIANLESQLADHKRLLADAMSALQKEREANEPVDFWPAELRVVRGPRHKWPLNDEHMFGKWQAKTGLPNATQYRTCIHPLCHEVQVRDAPKR